MMSLLCGTAVWSGLTDISAGWPHKQQDDQSQQLSEASEGQSIVERSRLVDIAAKHLRNG